MAKIIKTETVTTHTIEVSGEDLKLIRNALQYLGTGSKAYRPALGYKVTAPYRDLFHALDITHEDEDEDEA